MRMAHPCSGQSSRSAWIAKGVVALLFLAACRSTELPESIWPPKDFRLRLEELRPDGDAQVTVRRFTVRADGLAIYATSSSVIEDAESKTRLPVMDRLCIYQLVPECVRGLSRRLDLYCSRLPPLGEKGEKEDPSTMQVESVVVHMLAFDNGRDLVTGNAVLGATADILATIAAHFPDGEKVGVSGVAERGVANVLRGVPEPRLDAAGALAALQAQLARTPEDAAMLLEAFALAVHLGQRETAIELMERWKAVTVVRAFQDAEPKLTPAILERMLPRG